MSTSTTPPHIGIVIAAYNAGPFLGETLRSVQAQSHRRWTCVVVDDGSSDDTTEVARAAAAGDHRILVGKVPHGGHCLARNAGLCSLPSTVSLVTVMDADDVWEPDALETLVEGVERRPEAIGAHGLGEMIDSFGNPLDPGSFAAFGRARLTGRSGRLQPWPLHQPTRFENVFTVSILFPPGLILMKKEVYDLVGGYDPASIEGDWDLMLRATRFGELEFVDKPIVRYRRHAGNFGATDDMRRLTHETRVRAFHSPDNDDDQRAIVRACWQAVQRDRFRAQRIATTAALRDGRLKGAASAAARAGLAALRFLWRRPSGRRRALAAHRALAARSPSPLELVS